MAAAKKPQQGAAGSELIGQLAGEYRILRKIGAGGFGTVYEAEHPLLKRRAAVKVLHAHPAVDSVAVQRFIEEARSASQIRHRHIVDIFSFGTLENGQYFYVMDLLDGAPLDRYLSEHGRLAPEQALPLLKPIASAIDALHAASLVHRDLKPGNIYLAWDSNQEVVPKLLDFGLVKLLGRASVHTDTGAPLGTPYYMSPEQSKGDKIDARADIYSFGVICFELLTGTVPFSGDSATSVLVAHVVQEPPRPSEVCPNLSTDLDEPLLRMLAKDPNARPQSASAAVRELQLAAQSAGMTIGDTAPWLPRPAPREPTSIEEAFGGVATVAQSGTRGSAPLSERSKPRVLLLWAAAPLLLLGGFLVAQLYRERVGAVVEPAPEASASAARPELQPTAAGAAAAPAAAAPPAAPEPPPPVAVTLKGAPDGAEIWLGEQQLGAAPGPVHVPHGDQPVQLTVIVPGRGKRTLTLTPNAPSELTLPPEKPKPKRSLPRDLEDPF